MLPLPREAQVILANRQNEHTPAPFTGGHAGLWYDRFAHGWHTHESDRPLSFSTYEYRENGKKKSNSPALNWVNTLHGKKVGDQKMLEAFASRQRNLVKGCLHGEILPVQTDWHFITGMGNSHPVENGFAWHPTLGVPYLTGAAVKGLLRGWCEVWSDTFAGDGEDKADKLRLWFGPSPEELNPKKGSDKKKRKPAAGELIFFDAVPSKPVQLKADIMTPHYGKWYEEGDKDPEPDGSNVPADWHAPKPIPFLVVAPGASFRFAITIRATNAAKGTILTDVIRELRLALKYLGAGAKTASGYGRMTKQDDPEVVAGREWLDDVIRRTIHDLHAADEGAVLRGKPLAEQWRDIKDRALKISVRQEIHNRWQKLGDKWDNPPGKGAKRAKAIYGGDLNV